MSARGRSWWVGFGVVCVSLAGGCAAGDTTVVADGPNRWEQHKAHCDDVLFSPDRYPTDVLIDCTKRFETHRDVAELSMGVRSKYAVAFSHLWYEAPGDYERQIASQALARMCVPLHPRDEAGQVVETVPDAASCVGTAPGPTATDPNRAASGGAVDPVAAARDALASTHRSRVSEVHSTREAREIERALKSAERDLSEGRDSRAAERFEKILAEHTDVPRAHYGLARSSARLQLRDEAMEQLRALWALDDYEAIERLNAAATEPDFALLRADPEFKVMTGFVHVTLATEPSADTARIAEWASVLEGRGQPVARTLIDGQARSAPVVFYRQGYAEEAARIAAALGIPDAAQTEIRLDGPQDHDDVIAIWAEGEGAAGIEPPLIQGTSNPESRGAGDLIDAVDGAVGDGETLKKTGEGVGDAVPVP